MAAKETHLPGDTLLQQIVEDEDGNMHVMPETFLLRDEPGSHALTEQNELAAENLENDWPCADLPPHAGAPGAGR